jgi:hypothetical protein
MPKDSPEQENMNINITFSNSLYNSRLQVGQKASPALFEPTNAISPFLKKRNAHMKE